MPSAPPRARSPEPSARSSSRVLIIGPSNIGDAILSGDVIACVRQRFPQAHITLVVGERAKTLFYEDPRINTLVDYNAFSSFLGRLKLTLALWRYSPHFVVDLRSTLFPALLKPFSAWRYLPIPPKSILHMRYRYLWKLQMQISAIGNTLQEPPQVYISPKDSAHVDGLWRKWAIGDARPVVVICPAARSHIKCWITDGFAKVADRLIVEARSQVIFAGEPDEKQVIEDIRGMMNQRAHSAIGLTTIRQLGDLMRRSDLVITNDSASLHMASALRLPTVAIFGPTDAKKYGPTSLAHKTIRRRLFCSPCEKAFCRFNHECMRFVPSEEVFTAAGELLEAGTWKLEVEKEKTDHA